MDIEKTVNKILWGRCLVKAHGIDGVSKTFTLRSLTIREQNELDFLKETILQECEEDGILNRKDLMKIMSETEAWTDSDDSEIERLEREVRKLNHGIVQAEYHVTRKKMLEKNLKKTQFKLQELNSQRTDLLGSTAEARSEEVVRRYMIFMSATDKFGKQIWDTEEAFLASTDSVLVDMLTIRYLQNHIMPEKEVRKIARSGLWRFRWSVSKNGESLFGGPISEWSELQSALVYWSQFYDYVYESMDSPSDMVIENDAALDAWVSDQNKGSSSNKSRKPVNDSHQEQFIVVPDADKSTIDKVYDMNDKKNKDLIRREREQIKEKGSVSEWDLRKKGQ